MLQELTAHDREVEQPGTPNPPYETITVVGREVGLELRQLPRDLMHHPRLVYGSTNV
ncbi:MAG: hypothetical protein ACREWG_11290 [Gammaproteobacteria bacterium]